MNEPELASHPPSEGETRWKQSPLVRVTAIVIAVLALAGIVYSFAGTLGTTDSQRPRGGTDTHGTFGKDISAVVQTEARAVVQVRIRDVQLSPFAFTATLAGLPADQTGNWSAILDDGSVLPLAATRDGNEVHVALEDPLPTGREIDTIRLDPDASAGDIYLDLD